MCGVGADAGKKLGTATDLSATVSIDITLGTLHLWAVQSANRGNDWRGDPESIWTPQVDIVLEQRAAVMYENEVLSNLLVNEELLCKRISPQYL